MSYSLGKFAKMDSIKHRIAMLVVPTIVVGLLISAWASHRVIEEAVIENGWEEMHKELEERTHKVEMFHGQAKSNLLLAMENELFVQYFSLDETRQGNRYENNVLSSTQRQIEVRNGLERWAVVLHQRLPIVEACLIDRTGQEHLRVVGKTVAPAEEFSKEENKSPFFEPTLSLKKGEVNVSAPYLSPDAQEWVFAYTSPVVLSDGRVPGFFHYEVPLAHFQKMVLKQQESEAKDDLEGERYLILNDRGLVVLDSRNTISFKQKNHGKESGSHHGDEEVLEDYLTPGGTLYASPSYQSIVKEMTLGKQGSGTFELQGETFFVTYAPLPILGWSMADIHPQHGLLEGKTSLSVVRNTILAVSLAIIVVTILVLMLGMNGIIRPLQTLTELFREISQGNLNVTFPEYKGQDEIGILIHSSKKMNGMWSQLIGTMHLKIEELSSASQELDQVSHQLSNHARDVDKRTNEINKVLSSVDENISISTRQGINLRL